MEVHPHLDLPTPIMLDTLGIYSTLNAFPSFVLPLPTVAPRLTRLKYHCDEGPVSSEIMSTLEAVAPQLIHLTIALPTVKASKVRRRILSSLDSFLRSSISIKSLHLRQPTPFDIQRILPFLPNSCPPRYIYSVR